MSIIMLLTFLSICGANISSAYTNIHSLIELGAQYYYQENFAQSGHYFEQALALEPENPILLFNTGLMKALQGDHATAITHFSHALARDAHYVKAAWYLGKSVEHYDLEQAIRHYTYGLSLDPSHKEMLYDLAKAYEKNNQYEESIQCYQTLIERDPTNTALLVEAGNVCIAGNRFSDAITFFTAAAPYVQDQTYLPYNIAYCLRQEGKDAESIPYYLQTIALNPLHEQAHFGLAKSYLATGSLEQGWEEFEWRWHNSVASIQALGHHELTVSMLNNKKILIRAEWGLGDTIQFIRYAHLLKEHGAHVIAQVDQALIPLFSSCPFIDHLVPVGNAIPTFDYQIPLLSLPRLFATTLSTIPAPIPYLHAQPAVVEQWRHHFEKDTNLKIGICWQSKPDIFLEYNPFTKRSIPLSAFFELARLPHISLYSLQQVYGLEQLHDLPSDCTIHCFNDDFDKTNGRYIDTAAVMQYMDLIISVDTSIIHLAGALGKPVWVLIPPVAEWRWLHDRTDTPWYPTMRLFRLHSINDLHAVFKELYNEIEQLIAYKEAT